MQIIDRLRAWSREYFQKFLLFDHELTIPPNLLAPVPESAPDMQMGFTGGVEESKN